MQNVVFKFRRPHGAERQMPSVRMTDALRHLSQSPEFLPLIADASSAGKALAIEVFQTRNGQPILIHFTKEKV
jgi:hypothetical protein